MLRPPRDITEFERILLYGTLFPVVQDFLVRHHVLDPGTLGLWNFDEWRTRIRFTFEGLKNVPRSDSPRFVLAHILDPHPPFVFDRQGGRAIKPDPAEAYVDEVLFLNSQLRKVIAEILSEAEREPIIVLQGDHGFIPTGTPRSEQASLRAKFGILNAYYLPDGGTDRLYESISPVNSFRVDLESLFRYDLRTPAGSEFQLDDGTSLPTFRGDRRYRGSDWKARRDPVGEVTWIPSLTARFAATQRSGIPAG